MPRQLDEAGDTWERWRHRLSGRFPRRGGSPGIALVLCLIAAAGTWQDLAACGGDEPDVVSPAVTNGAATDQARESKDESSRPKIVLAGDSTVTDQAGWGQGFARCLHEDVVCVNLSAGGRSSKSFRDEGRWKKVLEERPTVILVQFGHNDQPGKGPARETDPETTYRENLARFVDEAKAIGATPVLVTSLARRSWDDDGKHIRSSLVPYVKTAMAVAQEKGVPAIDLHARSIAVYESLRQNGCERISPRGQDGGIDHTHLNAAGSELVGKMVAAELRRVLPAVSGFFDGE